MFEYLLSCLKRENPPAGPARSRPLRLETLEARVVLNAATLTPSPAVPPSLIVDSARVAAPTATVLRPVDPQQSQSHSLPPTSMSAGNGAVWATVTSDYVATAGNNGGTMDVYVDIHLTELNGMTPTGSVSGVPLVQGEALVHFQATGGSNGGMWQPSFDDVLTYSGDRNFAPGTWDVVSLSHSTADHPTLFLVPIPLGGRMVPLGTSSPADRPHSNPPSLPSQASLASASPSGPSSAPLASVGDGTTGSTGAGVLGSSSPSAPPTAATSSGLPDPMRDVFDSTLFGDLGQDFWLGLRSVSR